MFLSHSTAGRSRSRVLREKFLCGSILGAGALLAPTGAWAQTISAPTAGYSVGVSGTTSVDLTVANTGALTTTGLNLQTWSGTGSITTQIYGPVTNTNTSGNTAGVQLWASGATPISVTGTGAVQGYGNGIYARFTTAVPTSTISIDYSGSIRGLNLYGIQVAAASSNASQSVVNIRATDVQGASSGVYVTQAQSVTVTVPEGGLVKGVAGYGVLATATKDVTFNVDGRVQGGSSAGVNAGGGASAISVTGKGAIESATNIGILAQVSAGTISVSGTGSTTGSSGIGLSASSGSSQTSVTRSGDIIATTGYGISVGNAFGGATTIAGIGRVTAGMVGILVVGSGAVATTASTVDIGGVGGLTNSVSGGTDGVSVAGVNTINITTAAGGVVSGATGSGVVTTNTDAATAIRLGDAVSGGTYGVSATATGAGAVSVDVLAAARVTGGTAAIQTSSKDGATNINIDGQVGSATQAVGVQATSNGSGAVNVAINAGAALRGSVYALDLATKDGAVNVTRTGEISGSVRGAVTGAGSIVFDNLADLTLAGTTSYTGLTTFNNSATVAVGQDASLIAGTFVNKSGAVLTGTGTLGDVTAEAGSVIRPGDRALAAVNGVPAIGTLRVGALNLAAGSTVEIRADASGVSDKIVASGAATLNGATLNITATPGAATAAEQFKWSPGKTYTMLEAASVTGKFNLQTNLVFLTPTATYRDTGVDVTLARNSVTFDSIAVTPTQQTVGAVIQNLQSTATGAGKDLVVALANLTETQAQDALEKISGKSTAVAAAAPTTMTSTFSNTVSSQATGAVPAMRDGASSGAALTGGDMPAMAFAGDDSVQSAAAEPFKKVKTTVVTPAKTWRLWTSFFGSTSQLFARNAENLQGAMYHQWGGAVGFETMLADNFAGGVALSGMSGPFSVGKGALKGESSGGQIAVYGALDVGRNYMMASVSYGRFRTDATRTVDIPGTPTERLSNRTPSGIAGVQLEAGRRFDLDIVEATPFVGFQPSLTHASASTEKSSVVNSLYGLTYAANDTLSLPVLAGLQLKRGFAMELGWSGSIEARGALVHEFRPSRSTHAAFTVLPGSDFVSIGPSAALNTARLSTAIMATDNRGLTLSARIGGDFSSSMRSMRIEGGVKYDW